MKSYAVAFAVCFIIAAALFFLNELIEPIGAVEPGAPSKFDERLDELERDALDGAYQTQMAHLFGVWMKDERGQPERAIAGAHQARRAYIEVLTEIEKRQERRKGK